MISLRLLRSSNGQPVEIAPDSEINSGGEARIYAVDSDCALVAKVYRRPKPETGRKLRVMLEYPPSDPTADQGHASIAWPVDLLQSEGDGSVAGYLMPRVIGAHPILDLFNPSARREACPLFSYQYLYRSAHNLAAVMDALHDRDYVIGDVNESNILVMDTALVTVVDTDSFQVPDRVGKAVFHCPVAKPEFTPPELQGDVSQTVERTPSHDRFGLAVLIFQLLMEGTHPFSGVYVGEDDPPPYEARILAGHYPYGTAETPYSPLLMAPPIEILPSVIRTLFLRSFEDGHKNPSARPHASAWVKALEEAERDLVVCGVNDQHLYGNHLNVCPWCRRAALLGGRDPFPSKLRVISGRHREPIPVTSQSALPSASAPSIAEAVSAMSPPVGTDLSGHRQNALEADSLAAFTQAVKTTAQRLLARVRSAAERLRAKRGPKRTPRRITYTQRDTPSTYFSSEGKVFRVPWQLLLVVLAVILVVVAVGLSRH